MEIFLFEKHFKNMNKASVIFHTLSFKSQEEKKGVKKIAWIITENIPSLTNIITKNLRNSGNPQYCKFKDNYS